MTGSRSSLFLAEAVEAALAAADAPAFMQGVREGFDQLYKHLIAAPKSRKKTLDALDEAFENTRADIRRRRILELCAWPIFDKPSLPTGEQSLPEFLWIFALPFVVTLKASQLERPIVLEGEVLDADQLLAIVERSECLNKNASLRAFSTLVRREDLHASGPRNIATRFIEAELGMVEPPQPLPVIMDEEIESCRNVTLMVLCAARLTAGETSLFNRGQVWPAESVAALIKEGLLAQSVEVEAVTSLPPCSMAESLFHCSGAGLAELEYNLKEAQDTYGSLEVIIKHPMDGFAEINAMTQEGVEISLLPAFSFFEPKKELADCVRRICEKHTIGYKGAYTLSTPAPSLLQ